MSTNSEAPRAPISHPSPPSGPVASRQVVSTPNAAMEVTRLGLSQSAKKALTTGQKKLGDVK